MKDFNKLYNMVEESLYAGKTLGETIENAKSNGYTQEEAWNALVEFDQRHKKHPSTTIVD